jgi:hypothetical protein
MSVSAVIVTRGDVDMGPVIESLPFDDVIVWDNATRTDFKVYGRYLAVAEAHGEYIYTQDDDCVVSEESIAALLALRSPGSVVCNTTSAHRASYEPLHIGLVGWGAVFQRDAPARAFARYAERWPMDDMFMRECDRIFTGLTPLRWAELPFEHLRHAGARDRMFYDPSHQSDFGTVRERIAAL